MSGIGAKYNPKLHAWLKCGGKNKCPNISTYQYFRKFIVIIDGKPTEIIRKVPIEPCWARYSFLIKNSTYYNAGQKLKYSDRPTNEFGYWYGAPSGFGQPPRNQFN